MLECRDCGGSNIIEDYKDGSMVCTACGLVVSNFLIDDRPTFGSYNDIIYDNDINSVLSALDIDSIEIEQMASDILASSSRRSKVQKAFAVYEACCHHKLLRITKELVCAAFQIELKTLLQFLTKNTQRSRIVSHNINERLAKLAANIIDNPKLRMKAINAAARIEVSLQNNHEYMTKKPSKMDSVILFYVCTDVLNMKLNKKDYINSISISPTTFNRHVKLLRSCKFTTN